MSFTLPCFHGEALKFTVQGISPAVKIQITPFNKSSIGQAGKKVLKAQGAAYGYVLVWSIHCCKKFHGSVYMEKRQILHNIQISNFVGNVLSCISVWWMTGCPFRMEHRNFSWPQFLLWLLWVFFAWPLSAPEFELLWSSFFSDQWGQWEWESERWNDFSTVLSYRGATGHVWQWHLAMQLVWPGNWICTRLLGMQINAAIVENSMGCPQNIRNTVTCSKCTCSKKMKAVSWRDICTAMFIVALFTVAKKCRQPKYPQTHECDWKVVLCERQFCTSVSSTVIWN